MNEVRLGLDELKRFAAAQTIDSAYNALGYSYAQDCEYSNTGKYEEERARFLDRICWIQEPTSKHIRRFFNQLNAFYAEQWAMDHIEASPAEFLHNCNELVLYRQGKPIGPRLRPIQFGVRRDLDVLDPRRHFQLLFGIAPQLLGEAIESWGSAISRAPRHLDSVIALTMALIAIHPHADGNGRVARVGFTWLNVRYGLETLWLAEAEDGEFLRVGGGLKSTEYLMGRFVLQLCGNHNSVPYSADISGSNRDKAALNVLNENLAGLNDPRATLVKGDVFRALRTHLESEGHFQPSSPRFAALRSVLK